MENRYGFTFTGKGGGFRCEQHPSLAVKDDRSSFYWHSRGTGGYGVIDFLMKIENMSFYEAMESINIPCFTEYQPPKISQSEISKNFILPEKTEQQSHIFNYLYGKRGIAFEIVTALIEEEKIYGDVHGNSAPAFGVILIVERQPTEQYLSKNTDWSLLYYAKYF